MDRRVPGDCRGGLVFFVFCIFKGLAAARGLAGWIGGFRLFSVLVFLMVYIYITSGKPPAWRPAELV